MAVTKCPIPAHTVIAFTVLPRATCQRDRTRLLDGPRRFDGEDHAQDHDESRSSRPKDELRDAELKKMGAFI
jgi:hypothetical protein